MLKTYPAMFTVTTLLSFVSFFGQSEEVKIVTEILEPIKFKIQMAA
jgi:hypothetical protein